MPVFRCQGLSYAPLHGKNKRSLRLLQLSQCPGIVLLPHQSWKRSFRCKYGSQAPCLLFIVASSISKLRYYCKMFCYFRCTFLCFLSCLSFMVIFVWPKIRLETTQLVIRIVKRKRLRKSPNENT